ncbi:hypothetical protein HYPSUDRAFT_134575 [Hypholoma sublateritium FD-334 SS-4]|uniref:Uncharacterized protein n=1 Tax=Hypholoma sublateritium (strain FD-334 SS-4) TaxID=945553 RepID=A0A0D2LDU1_HYPSF|nr:hypothetical protein HYPSUDRAFT_134575 [Hypholoma sublateritium FD-334 SS-4]
MVGTMANWILYGVLWVQVYLYYVAFPKDNPALKIIVFLELVLETVQSVAVTHDLVQFCIFVYTDSVIVEQLGTSWYSVALLTGLIAILSQAFYCYRVAVLTRSKYAVALISMVSVMRGYASDHIIFSSRSGNFYSFQYVNLQRQSH